MGTKTDTLEGTEQEDAGSSQIATFQELPVGHGDSSGNDLPADHEFEGLHPC